MTDLDTPATRDAEGDGGLRRSITGRLLFFYVLGDVLGSGIYVLIGAVALAVGGAFWVAFAVGITVATITGLAYAELVTKYPQAAGAALYVNKAFDNRPLTFLITVCMLSASFAASGSLATGFASYFNEVWDLPPALLLTIAFIVLLSIVNFIGITESVVINMLMTFVEVAGLIIVMIIGVWYVLQGNADFGILVEFETESSPVLGVISGVALAFFAMTGFENAANVAEETVDPAKTFPRALIGGMVAAGVIYVLVAIAAALTVPLSGLQDAGANDKPALLEVVKEGIIPPPVGFMVILFSIIAMIAITNTTLVSVVTQSRILYGMAREDVVPGVFARIHSARRSPWVALLFSAVVVIGLLMSGADIARLATVTVVFTLFIYALVIVSALKLRGQDEDEDTFIAPLWLLVLGILGNLIVLTYVIYDDPGSLVYCAALLAVGLVLFLAEHFFGSRNSPGGNAVATSTVPKEI
ncbi:amino acid transporter [Nocardioides szechwanensis]|uniref:Amino acid/polyamine/organocation transporter, APC superfamily n=1 Tax=Nocardioides szechwanensis TaxID=1005944 RepID=A0A1H0G3P7_9ACTN|nr:APC family permease [Nocardioides szechwanensis]GEP35693.1 amino acid transporter [Nocardioides szechwanensis]SDO01525.1 amino acid/polyamine/organocation transporter, APC superfamily [Nocardioides szechwanensis]